MKIERVRVNNFRGIPSLDEAVDSENIGLVGPNGSGKSSVIEAIDFLLTGEVQSMSGDGTGGIQLSDHAPHIDSEPEDAWVEIEFEDEHDSVTLRRTVGENDLEHEGELPAAVQSLIDAADRGQHLLSRREILEFVVSQKQSRSERLRTLLKLRHVKDKRLELQGAVEHINSNLERTERERKNAEDRLLDLFGDDLTAVENLRDAVNDRRTTLGGEELATIEQDTEFRAEIDAPADQASASPLQSTNTQELLQTLTEWFEGGVEEFIEVDSDLRVKVEEIRSNQKALRDLEVLSLIQEGRQLIEYESGRCPLCLTEWDPDELLKMLDAREQRAESAKKLKDELDELRQDELDRLTSLRTALESLIDILDQHDAYGTEALGEMLESVGEYESAIEGDLIEQVPLSGQSEAARKEHFTPDAVDSQLQEFNEEVDEKPQLDELQDAWDVLGSANEHYDEMRTLDEESEQLESAVAQMEQVHEAFIDARDAVLNDTYDAISERFEEYYRTLHDDEDSFDPDLNPTETGLDFQVGFHGHGKHPPHALHSEGHQDSMGLCLYLALCDYLEGEDLPLIMLDDVVMSVDADHRRPLARLLKEEISSDFQIIITTHDELWYRHLKTAGVLSRQGTIKFSGWSLEEGPHILGRSGDEWDRIEELLDEGDVQAAAHRLRHTAEWFLREACHNFNAKVQFKSDGRWTLGDFDTPAKSAFKKLLKQAKRAGQSWGHDIEPINELDRERKDVYERVQKVQGDVNPNVHFNPNEWATYTPSELEPVVEAFRDLYELFWCDSCHACLHVVEEDHTPVQLRCRCGEKANWTLEED